MTPPTRLPTTPPARGGAARLAITIAALVALAHSLWFTWAYFQATPWLDMWDWVGEFRAWRLGTFGWHELIAVHNDHRIATARLVFIVDAVLFHMSGRFVTVANLLLLGCLGCLLHRLWRDDSVRGTAADLPPVFFVAFMASICQLDNLVSPFQIQFALLCVFATAAAGLLAGATSPGAPPWRALTLALGAAIAFGLAVFSLGGGVLLLPPLLLLLAMRRARAAVIGAFMVPAGFMLAAFFTGYHFLSLAMPTSSDRAAASVLALRMGGIAAEFIGSALAAHGGGVALAAGLAGMALLGLFAGSALGTYRRGSVAPGRRSAFLALAAFVVLNAAAAARLRLLFGFWAGLANRYAGLSLLFWVCIAGIATQLALAGGAGRARLVARPVLVPALAVAALLAVNVAPDYEQQAASIRRALDIAATTMRAGVLAPTLINVINPWGLDLVIDNVHFAQREKLSVFAISGRPPARVRDLLHRAVPASLPGCKGGPDMLYRLDASRVMLRAWLTNPSGTRSDDWVEIIDGAQRVLATLPAQEQRDDLPALPDHAAPLGVLAGFVGGADGGPWTLVGSVDGKSACRLTVPNPGPVRIQAMPKRAPPALSEVNAANTPAGPPALAPPWPGAPLWITGGEAGAARDVVLSVRPPSDGQAGLGVPFATVGNQADQSLVFAFSDGTRLSMKVPPDVQTQWRMAAVPPEILADHSGPVTIIAHAPAPAPGQFLAIGAAFAVRLDPDAAKL